MGTHWIVWLVVLFVVSGAVAYLVNLPRIRRRRAVEALLAEARRAVEADPEDQDARARLAKVLLAPGDRPAEALEESEKILARSPAHWAEGLKPTRMLRAEALVALGRLEEAIEAFEMFVASVEEYVAGDEEERKWQIEVFKVEAEQRIRLLRRGDTHVHQPERWGETELS